MKKKWGAFLKLLRPFLGWEILLILLAAIQAGSQVAFSLVTKEVIDSAVNRDGRLAYWGLILAAVVGVILLVYLLQLWYTGRTQDHCMAKMRHALLTSVVRSEDMRLQAYHSGELLSRGMEDVRIVCEGMVNSLPTLASQGMRLVGAFVAVLTIYPPIGPVLLGAGGALAVTAMLIRPISKRRYKAVRETEDQVMAQMQENLHQLELIKSIQVEKNILKRFYKKLKMDLKTKSRRRRWTTTSSMMIYSFSRVGMGVLLFWGAMQVAANVLTYGEFTAMQSLVGQFRGPAIGLSGQFSKLATIEVAAARLSEMLESEEDAAPCMQDVPKIHAVVFENVTFRYPSDIAPVVDNFSIRIPLENWSCLTGHSGKGKSTLFKLMLGLYAPQEGSVYLETDRGDIPCGKETRHFFAYVPQDYALFSGTVLENLQLVAPDADEAAIKNAISVAQADYIWDQTYQLETQVRENNAGLSKGQLQRLAIARAVLMERPVFLLDECTSALDAQTEDAVLQNLQKMGKQAILVTHRPEALEKLETIAYVSMENT
ncbi:MAG: ABC transporter ATP-binding protein [Oscillospiraceae bacterium]|nr:ABC transporter ATP-binding protein [Oscillospiraceae bacterium]